VTPACACGQPSPDAFLCKACTRELSLALLAAVTLAPDLEVAVSRQARFTGPQRGGGGSVLPFDERASDAAHALHAELSGWVRIHMAAGDYPAGGIAAMARWLLARTGRIRQHEGAADCHHGVTRAVRDAMRAIDRPPQRVYAGPCDCGTDLTAKPGRSLVSCPSCGASYGVAQRQEWMRTQLEDTLGTAAYAAAVLPGIGVHVTAGAIRMWASRHKLEARPGVPRPGGAAQPRYRLGDVMALARAAAAERDAGKAG
jgi:hypothetical protein